jgi:general secretion pathway protein N
MKISFQNSKTGRIGIIAIPLIGVFLLAFNFPISWASPLVASKTNCAVNLESPQGSIWSGSASISLGNSVNGACAENSFVTERIVWSSSCNPLKISCEINISSPMLSKPGRILITPSGSFIQSNELALPAKILQDLGAPWNTIKPEGQLSLAWGDLTFSNKSRSGNMSLTISNASSQLSSVRPLGDYIINVNSLNTSLFEMKTLKGALDISGKGSMTGHGIEFTGEAMAKPEYKEALTGLLSVIGKTSNGITKLQF